MSEDVHLPCDVELPYSIPAACQQEPDGFVECQFCNNKVAPWHFVCKDCYADGCRSYYFPPTLPETARAILDLDKPRLSDKQEREASGIARATERLNSGDHRYGFMADR